MSHCKMSTEGIGDAGFDLNDVVTGLAAMPKDDWSKVVAASEEILAASKSIDVSGLDASPGTYHGFVAAGDGHEVTLKVFVFGAGSDTPFHTHEVGCGSTNIGTTPILNINFKVLGSNPITHLDTIQITSIDVLQPGQSMVDTTPSYDKGRYGHAIVNSSNGIGVAVHPYHYGPGTEATGSNRRIYTHGAEGKSFMEALKNLSVDKLNTAIHQTLSLKGCDIASTSTGRRYLPHPSGDGVASCLASGGIEGMDITTATSRGRRHYPGDLSSHEMHKCLGGRG